MHKSQDALRDRMVTIDVDFFDYDTEVAITRAKSRIPLASAKTIVNIVRDLRDSGKCEFPPTVRGCIIIAKTLKGQGFTPAGSNGNFLQICQDILASETSRVGKLSNQKAIKDAVKKLVHKHVRKS